MTDAEKIELRSFIATRLMGLTRHDESYDSGPLSQPGRRLVRRFVWRDAAGRCVYSGDCFVPDYTGNLADAWLVVEAMRERGWRFNYTCWCPRDATEHCAEFGDHGSEADTAPLAICRAARAALEAEDA